MNLVRRSLAGASVLLLTLLEVVRSCPGGGRSLYDKQQSRPHVIHENRVGKDWNYIPNYGLNCQEIGCCGLATTEEPNKQACGPEYWQYLSNVTAVRCVPATGGQQSPINFQTVGNDSLDIQHITALTGNNAVGQRNGKLLFSKNLCPGKLEFLANTWEVVFEPNCTLHVEVLGKKWHLVQWHLHNAEHSVNGLYYPLEVHMVHMTEQNETLVVGLFLTTGETSRFFDQLKSEDLEVALKPLDPYEIIQDGKFWHYTGSLTTPPCQTHDGGKVEWFVMQTPETVNTTDMYMFTSYFATLDKAYDGRVNRNIQDLLQSTDVFTSSEPSPPPPLGTKKGGWGREGGKRAVRGNAKKPSLPAGPGE